MVCRAGDFARRPALRYDRALRYSVYTKLQRSPAANFPGGRERPPCNAGQTGGGTGAAGRWCCGGQPAAIALASSSPMKIFSSAAVNPRSTQLCTVTARLNLPGRQKFSTSLGMVRSKTTASGNSTP